MNSMQKTPKSKRMKELYKDLDTQKLYNCEQALSLILERCKVRFDSSVDVVVGLGVDPKQSNQQVRGVVNLPHGLGKEIKILVFTKGLSESELKAVGADYVGSEDLIEKIQQGWIDFDVVLATPDMMPSVAKVAKVLGPRGLMPNPKSGTVTNDIVSAVKMEKKGRLSFKIDKSAYIRTSIGKKSLGLPSLKENLFSFLSAVLKAKPSTSKGIYFQSLGISSSMGVGIKVDTQKTLTELGAS